MKQGASWPRIIASCFAVAVAAMLLPLRAASVNPMGETLGHAVPSAHILDGKKFFGQAGAKGKGVHHEDILSFSDGMFESSACVPLTFSSGPYTATAESGLIHFKDYRSNNAPTYNDTGYPPDP